MVLKMIFAPYVEIKSVIFYYQILLLQLSSLNCKHPENHLIIMNKKISVVATNACGWPNLTKLKNGQVLCTYFNAPSHGLMQGDLICSISDRNGLNWRKRGMVAKHPKGGNRMHLAVGMANNGDLLCFSSGFYIKEEKFAGFSGHWLSRSTDR